MRAREHIMPRRRSPICLQERQAAAHSGTLAAAFDVSHGGGHVRGPRLGRATLLRRSFSVVPCAATISVPARAAEEGDRYPPPWCACAWTRRRRRPASREGSGLCRRFCPVTNFEPGSQQRW